jgi:hypothetical protein
MQHSSPETGRHFSGEPESGSKEAKNRKSSKNSVLHGQAGIPRHLKRKEKRTRRKSGTKLSKQ